MSTALPNHVGFILDGNRRWANQNNLPSLEGHKKGSEVFQEIALHAFRSGIKNVSGFVFSTENWQRTDEEVGYLMSLVVKAVDNYLDEFNKEGIKILILGRRDGLRSKVLKSIKKAEESTKNNKNGTLGICFNYGGQEEIVDAVNKAIEKSNYPISKDNISSNLYGAEMPNLDLIVRTSGEHRLSGFMLWRSAYAELIFEQKYWPDYSKADFDNTIENYKNRQRRFGC